MKQIKTVILPLEASETFDKMVNDLLLCGWKITNRRIINAKSEPNEACNVATIPALYAELEKG